MSIMPTDCSLMVQSKCLTYEAFRGSGLGNQLILEDLRNIWLSDPATSWELDLQGHQIEPRRTASLLISHFLSI